ncbi:hypothetical protein BU25DRAFT_492498 [Macroventuria anomochaeta]|uniref:Uncharacterized protein n=1 Tax=Macroventuria anomochaeta TaxID=301207 RepID=A0ACB6RVL7_9PLEO|nr:uncharacterized protein BU25DRAFT_492498 [Macroventuria anomochaeta]KAF2625961.1 hypothetical protein BU25DRAFT_492498 [Macroventuria anomochaeta]
MKPPLIRVEDGDSTEPVLTLRYTSGENDLEVKIIYADINSLLDHPGRARLDQRRKIIPCSDAFLDTFWSAAASLLDYFADFYATDTALMQSIWFHLLDIWQKASPLPLYHIDFDFCYSTPAQLFEKDYKDTIALIHRLISPKSRACPDNHNDSLIHDPSGTVEGLTGSYETGPFISGLAPWQQFLYSGAPGFKPVSPEQNDAREADEGNTRYTPQPAIALIQAHTARARALAVRVAEIEDWDLPATLAAFDANALAIPNTITHPHTYASLLHPGTGMSYQLLQGAPPVRRHEGLSDPSMMIDTPDLVLLDEAVGTCKGREAYVPMTGPVGQAGVGFDVWAVTESEDVLGWENRSQSDGRSGVAEGAREMFDEWYFGDEGV